MDLKVIKLSAVVLIALAIAPSLLGLVMVEAKTYNGYDYMWFEPGHYLKYTETINTTIKDLEVVYQETITEGIFITLNFIDREHYDSSLLGGIYSDKILFTSGYPSRNEHNLWFLVTLPTSFNDEDMWKHNDVNYQVDYVGDWNVNEETFTDVIKITINSMASHELYMQGEGEAYLAKNVGIIDWEFRKVNGEVFNIEIEDWGELPPRIISGRVTLDGVYPATGYHIGLSNMHENDATSQTTDEMGEFSFVVYGHKLTLRYAPILTDGTLDWSEITEYELFEVDSDITDLVLSMGYPLIPTYSVSGTVYFGSTSLEDIPVELTRDGEETPISSTTTSPEGFYVFSDVAPRLYWVTAYGSTEEYLPYHGYRVEVIDEDVTKDIDLPKLLTLLSPDDKAIVTTSRPTFSWEAFPDAVRYSISVHDKDNWLLNPVWEDTKSTTSHTLETELSYGKEYAWSIYAYDSNNHLIGTARPWWSFTITKPTQTEVQIGEILFISEKGKILHSMRTGQVFNVLVLVEKINPEWGWTPLWLDLYIDDVKYASHGTGVNQGFIVLSTRHDSFSYNERGKHTVRVELFERLGDEKGELLEEKTISFKIKGKPLKHPPF